GPSDEYRTRIGTGRLLAHPFDEERDPHVGAPLVEVVASQAGGHEVDRLDVAQGAAGLGERLLHRVVGALARSPDQLDDLHCRHASPPSRVWKGSSIRFARSGLAAPGLRVAPGVRAGEAD